MSTGAIAETAGWSRASVPARDPADRDGLFNPAQYTLTVTVFLPLMLSYFHVPPAAPMLLFPIFVGLQVIFTSGVALNCDRVAFFRDVRHLVDVGLAWRSGRHRSFTSQPASWRPPPLMLPSPMASYIGAYQDIFYYRQWPDAAIWVIAIAYGVGAFVSVCGHRHNEDSFAERI